MVPPVLNGLAIFIYLFGFLWVAICAMNLVAPRFMWKLTESWKAHKEPSPGYFLLRRIMALIFLLFGATMFGGIFVH